MLFQSSSSNKCHSRNQSSNLEVCRRKPPRPVLYSKWAKHKYYNVLLWNSEVSCVFKNQLTVLTLVDWCPILLDEFKTCRHWRIHHPSESLKIPSHTASSSDWLYMCYFFKKRKTSTAINCDSQKTDCDSQKKTIIKPSASSSTPQHGGSSNSLGHWIGRENRPEPRDPPHISREKAWFPIDFPLNPFFGVLIVAHVSQLPVSPWGTWVGLRRKIWRILVNASTFS